jgi:hypothetical protein
MIQPTHHQKPTQVVIDYSPEVIWALEQEPEEFAWSI